MRKKPDLIGKKFNHWTVVSFSHVKETVYNGVSKVRGNYWNCVCKCGKQKQLSTTVLKTNKSKSCGCHFPRKQTQFKIKEGNVYGYLTVKKIEETGKWGVKCKVECVCGKELVVSGRNLRRDKANYSCGCIGIKLDSTSTGLNSVISYYKQSAKIRNLEFELTREQFKNLTDSACHYCGIEESNENRGYKYNGIDRKNNKIGYVLDNCVTCCKDCNIAKSTMTYEQYKSFIIRVYEKMFLV